MLDIIKFSIVITSLIATLSEFQHRLQQKTDVLMSISTVDRMLRRQLNLTFKNKASIPPKRGPIESNSPDLNTGNRSAKFRPKT